MVADTDWRALFIPERPGAFCVPRGVRGGSGGGARDGVSPATWWLPGLSSRPSWSGATLVNLGDPPGVTHVFTVMGAQ